MEPYKTASKNEIFSGLNFSLSDINFENSGLNLVPISLEANEIKEDELPPYEMSNIIPSNNSKLCESSGIYSRYVLNPETHVTDLKTDDVNFDPNFDVGRDFVSPCDEVGPHWFYEVAGNLWRPFSVIDSFKVESKYKDMYAKEDMDNFGARIDDCVAVEGGKYDVHVTDRIRVPVYWEEDAVPIRRVSWLYREEEGRCQIPYTEVECDLLEAKFQEVVANRMWHQWVQVTGICGDDGVIDDQFVFHSAHTMAEYRRYSGEDSLRARVVYRGVGSLSHLLEQGVNENGAVDHVILVVHGIGPVCDYRGHNLVQCVSEMRLTSNTMMRQHMPGHLDRVEYLPVCWNKSLHVTIDEHLARVTLPSVPKLRVFTNGALVDVLCYSSPRYCQAILTSVATEMNRLRHLFVSRNPQYDGSFSIIGHSLGAVIALDLVSLQDPGSADLHIPLHDPATVPILEFELGHVFALGSPMALFLTARGLPVLGSDCQLIACKGVFNIFHPFDPVAYRLEPMITGEFPSRAVLIPHHKGRKRLHLELKDNLVKVGTDLKTRLLQTLKITWTSLQDFASAHKTVSDSNEDWQEEDVLRVLEKIDDNSGDKDDSLPAAGDSDIIMGSLNGGRRVDYVLQEAPLESFNDYLFALGSHACYWDSEDTVLKILKEVYLCLGIVTEQSQSTDSTEDHGACIPLSRDRVGHDIYKHSPLVVPHQFMPPTHKTMSGILPPQMNITTQLPPQALKTQQTMSGILPPLMNTTRYQTMSGILPPPMNITTHIPPQALKTQQTMQGILPPPMNITTHIPPQALKTQQTMQGILPPSMNTITNLPQQALSTSSSILPPSMNTTTYQTMSGILPPPMNITTHIPQQALKTQQTMIGILPPSMNIPTNIPPQALKTQQTIPGILPPPMHTITNLPQQALSTSSSIQPPSMNTIPYQTMPGILPPHALNVSSSILPPPLPVLQASSFFQPASPEIELPESGSLGIDQLTMNYTEASPQHIMPSPSSYMASSSSDINSPLMLPCHTNYHQSNIAYFQPESYEPSQPIEMNTHFSDETLSESSMVPSSDDHASLASIYYQKFDTGHRQSPQWMPMNCGSDTINIFTADILHEDKQTYAWNDTGINTYLETQSDETYLTQEYVDPSQGTQLFDDKQPCTWNDSDYSPFLDTHQKISHITEESVTHSHGTHLFEENQSYGWSNTEVTPHLGTYDDGTHMGQEYVANKHGTHLFEENQAYGWSNTEHTSNLGKHDTIGHMEQAHRSSGVTDERAVNEMYPLSDSSNNAYIGSSMSLASEVQSHINTTPSSSTTTTTRDNMSSYPVRSVQELDSYGGSLVNSRRGSSSTTMSNIQSQPWQHGSRTPSPQIIGQATRLSSKNPPVLSSRPLVPQSGKLFTKRKQ